MAKLLLSRNEVAELLGISLSSFNRRRKDGRMPEPVPGFDGDSPKWSYAEIKAWVDAGAPTLDRWRMMKPQPVAIG